MHPGKWSAVACTAQWTIFTDTATNFSVTNYLSETKFSELAAENRNANLNDDGLFGEVDSSEASGNYKSQTLNYREANPRRERPERWISQQICTVGAMFYSTLDGEPDNDSLTNIYWAFKDQGQISIDSSFMLCDEQTCTDPLRDAELTSIEYTFFDYDFERPQGQNIGHEGAAYLATAVVTLLSALISLAF